ncbi:MAG: hypothetical protein MI921_27995 [Cytophagales bacterium]|nr:hypothetical protein [Cytophagales bacterium]
MDNEILKLLNQEVIETKRLASAAWEGVKELKLQTVEMRQQTAEIRELVMITRNEMQLRTRPWWKKLFGIAS